MNEEQPIEYVVPEGALSAEQVAMPPGAIEPVPVVAPISRIMNLPPEQQIVEFKKVAEVLADIVEKNELWCWINGKKYVEVAGWTAMMGLLGIFPRAGDPVLIQDEDGHKGWQCRVDWYSFADQKMVTSGTAVCTQGEPNWNTKKDRDGKEVPVPSYARCSMAQTRGTGKGARLAFPFVLELAGYEATPAEEMIDLQNSSKMLAEAKDEGYKEGYKDAMQSLGYTSPQANGEATITYETYTETEATKEAIYEDKRSAWKVLKGLYLYFNEVWDNEIIRLETDSEGRERWMIFIDGNGRIAISWPPAESEDQCWTAARYLTALQMNQLIDHLKSLKESVKDAEPTEASGERTGSES